MIYKSYWLCHVKQRNNNVNCTLHFEEGFMGCEISDLQWKNTTYLEPRHTPHRIEKALKVSLSRIRICIAYHLIVHYCPGFFSLLSCGWSAFTLSFLWAGVLVKLDSNRLQTTSKIISFFALPRSPYLSKKKFKVELFISLIVNFMYSDYPCIISL